MSLILSQKSHVCLTLRKTCTVTARPSYWLVQANRKETQKSTPISISVWAARRDKLSTVLDNNTQTALQLRIISNLLPLVMKCLIFEHGGPADKGLKMQKAIKKYEYVGARKWNLQAHGVSQTLNKRLYRKPFSMNPAI